MRKLDTRALELFAAVATCLNFRQAAEQLHMTQPPLSRAIRLLEERLGTRLFERDTQGVALTAAGARLLPHAQRILAQLDAAEDALAGHTSGAPVRLGLTNAVEPGSLRPFTDALAAALPQAPTLHVDASPRLVAALRAGRLDAAVIALPTNTYELAVLPLGSQPLLAALPSSHPLARRRRVRLADLQGEPLFWFERARQNAYFDHCHAVFRRHGFAPRFLREPRDHHVLLGDIAAGIGIALLPASFAALRRQGVRYLPLAEGAELAVGLGLATAGEHLALKALREVARARLAEQR
ncbi:DNA-binding transcriptional LysR family regulator [Pseudoduganella flava]|uniref:DNA-binding transcriptional LysR family regulator n=1 Tax=Pseudoduganella flava TaxID=871742 RepID=A0A562PT27_9BURK|nr:LysR family transcriptional regulator [Pseudoduganella flava]QGZ39122.1 LysR family transcriptional regulator [Pseudoduganella flava]TWI47591.1 DNA-binding transcriptional LysR family regulator [Pseudoduganella flava]